MKNTDNSNNKEQQPTDEWIFKVDENGQYTVPGIPKPLTIQSEDDTREGGYLILQ